MIKDSSVSLLLLKTGETIISRTIIKEVEKDIILIKPLRISLVKTDRGIRPQVTEFPLMMADFYLTTPREEYTLDKSEIFVIYEESELKKELLQMYLENTSEISIVTEMPKINPLPVK